MIKLEIKQKVTDAIREARKSGVRLKSICDIFEISSKTIQRWDTCLRKDGREGSARNVPHRLSEIERQEVIDIACNPRFKDMYPCEIVAILATEGTYIASESTFYRILREEKMLSHRRKSKAPVKREKPRLMATAPDQVYSWDITYIKTSISGIYFYLYLVVDIFSRRIVQWELHENETSAKAASMLKRLSNKKLVKGITLHSDNGSPMKGLSMLATMQQLGVVPSFSRPRVSTDNPYSESLFRTLKYQSTYPGYFDTIEESREWVNRFAYWYNHEHMHSGISFVTPHERHYGKDIEILKARQETYQKACETNPGRWSGKSKPWTRKEVVYINPIVEENEHKLVS